MGTLAEALRNASFQPVEAPADVSQGVLSEFGKGLNSGTTGMGAGLRAIAGTAGEALGFDEFAQSQYDAARQAELRAQAEAPRVSSYKDVGGLRDAIHYGAGVLGGSAPSIALGMGAGMAAGTAARALMAGTLAQAPLEAGDVALKQLHDPGAQDMGAGERLLRQGVGGAASAALQTIVPAHVGGKLVGRGVENAAKMTMKQAALRNLGAIPAEGGFEGGGEIVKQMFANDANPVDWENVKENVVGGMVGGAPMAGVGFMGDTMHGAPGKAADAARGGFRSIRERLEAGKDKIAEKTPVKVKSAVDDIGEFISGKYQKVKDMATRVAAGGTVADPAEFAGMDDAQIAAKLAEDDKTKAQVVKEWGDELLNKAGLTPERRAEVAEAVKNVADPAAQTIIAKAKAAADKASEIGASIDRALRGVRTGAGKGEVIDGETREVFDDHVHPDGGWIQVTQSHTEEAQAAKEGEGSVKDRVNYWANELKDPETQAAANASDEREAYVKQRVAQGMTAIQALKEWKAMNEGKKLSEDTSGYQYRIATKMLTELGIKDSHPEIFDDYETTLATIDLLGNLTAQMEKSPKVDGSLLMETVNIFGPQAADIVNRMYAKVGSAKPEVRENVYKAITEMAAVADHRQRLLDLVTKSVTPEYQQSTRVTDMPSVLNALINIERGGLGHLTAAEQTFKNMGVVRAYAAAFGDKGMDIRNAVRKYVDSTRATVKYGVDKNTEKAIAEDDELNEGRGDGRIFDADGDEIGEHATARETMRYGGPIRKQGSGVFGVEDGPAILRGDADQLITGVQKKYGERYSVEFEPLHEGSEYGHVVVREQAGRDDFTDRELSKLKLDTKKYPKSPSRIDLMTGDGERIKLDAAKVARYTLNKGSDMTSGGGESTYLQRLADSFRRGMASLIAQTDGNIVLPGDEKDTVFSPVRAKTKLNADGTRRTDGITADFEAMLPDNLVVDYRDGKQITWGQIKNLHASEIASLEQSFSKQGQAELKTLRDAYRTASTDAARRLVTSKLMSLMQKEKDRELSQGDLQTHDDAEGLNKKSGLAWRLAKQRKTPHYQDQETGNMVREHRNSIFDDEGNLTKAGAKQLLEGSYDGGIDIPARSTNIEGTEGLINRADYFDDARNVPNYEGEGETKVRAKPNRRDYDGGQGRREIGRDENIHLTTAIEGDIPGRSRYNMDGSNHRVSDRVNVREALVNLAGELKARSGAGVKALGAKLEALAKNNALPDAEISTLTGVLVRDGNKPTAKTSDIAAIVNPLYEKYGTAAAPATKAEPLLAKAIAQRAEYLRNPPADYSPEKARGIIDWAAKQLERIDAEKGGDADRQDQLSDYRSGLKQLIKDAKRITEADAELERKMGPQGSTPNPKAVAAKKAAFLEKVASGDKALIEELRSSNDAKGLQRAAEALDEHAAELAKDDATADHLIAAYDAINDRLAELVQNESTAYGLQTKKYSLVSDTVHFALEREGFAAAHDSPIRHEGKFDWRAHTGKGEGNAAFGAGTYLSTADTVHRHYKGMFTAMTSGLGDLTDDVTQARERLALEGKEKDAEAIRASVIKRLQDSLRGDTMWHEDGRNDDEVHDLIDKAKELSADALLGVPSPTYHVSVDIKPEQLLDWDKPIGEQPEILRLLEGNETVTNAIEDWKDPRFEFADPLEEHYGGDLYRTLTKSFREDLRSYYGFAQESIPMPSEDRLHAEAQAKASDFLQSLGVLGHVYDAAGGKEDTRRNYVVYDDSKITTNYVQFSKGQTSASANARLREAEVAAYLDRVLGKSVKRVWSTFTHAGEFERMKLHDVIRLSVHALDPLGTAYHESLHAFFAQLRDAGAYDIIGVLEKAAKQPHVIAQLEKIYANQPAVLKQLKDPEERVAYMYQHWVADPKGFKVNIGAKTAMQKVMQFIRGVLGIWSNDARAVHIMEYFNSGEYAKNIGKPNAVRRALMEPGTNKVVEAFKPLVDPLDRLAEATFASGDARLRDTGIEALITIADMIKLGQHDASGLDRGFVPAARMEATKRLAKLGDLLAEYSPEQQREALEHLQKQTVPSDAKVFDLVAEIKQTLQETRDYMVKSGMNVGNLGPDYFPRVWDVHYMTTHEDEVRAMLEKYVQSGQYKGNVSNLLRDLLGRDGTEYMGETATPGMQHAKRRKLDFITPEDAAPFMRKDLGETLVSYITQATRRAEWQRRFGANVSPVPGEYLSRIDELKIEARNQGATDEDMRTLDLYLKSVDGTLGDTMDPGLRRMMGNMIVYQNVRLLPLAAFSMAVDPLGIMVRGGTLKESYDAAVRGLKSIVTTLKGNGKPDEIEQLAELMGVIDAASISHVMSDIYTQGMVGGKMRKINDLFFKYNFVEGINRSMRVGATEAAMRFLAKHADGKASAHSKRWMAELGLKDGDVKWLAAEKRIALTKEDGLTAAQEQRIHLAINQWVDGAVLRPDATDKPIWMNDPHWALISHLKQFVFTFQKVILGRVAHEFKNGNYTPAMALSMYVPTMIVADTLKGLLQGGGDVPEWKRGWGPAEYISHGVQRAGLFGVGQFGVDVLTDLRQGGTGIGALSGPTIEQLGGAIQALGGRKQFGPMLLDSLPANALYKNWFDSDAASSEPMFST